MIRKTEYVPYLKLESRDGKKEVFEVRKTWLCDMAKANACQKRAQWYGYQKIGPRTYAMYSCPRHGKFNVRI